MYAKQLQLPKLPIPALAKTVAKYLDTLKPLCSAAELARASKQADAFLTDPSQGPELQALLHQWAEDKPNFLEPLWDTAYLETRIANPVNTNYFLHHRLPPGAHWAGRPGVEAQLQHAAVLAHAAALFFVDIRDEKLPAEDDGRGGPVCMSQYPRVFGHARIAKQGCDELRNYNSPPEGLPTSHFATQWMNEAPRHVAVLVNHHVARVDILDERGQPLPSECILQQLQTVLKDAERMDAPPAAVGALTYLDRDSAAAARAAVERDSNGRALLQCIDSALFVLCLDGVQQQQTLEQDTVLRRVMHGQASEGNRWFDKHNLIVMPHGIAAWNLEHAQGDATPILKLLDAQVQHRDAAAMPSPTAAPPSADYRVLPACLNADVQAQLQSATREWERMDSAVQVSALEVPVGSRRIKAAGCPPDAFVQQVFQAACLAQHEKPAAAYESVATRGFLHGRTEVGRSTTSASVALAQHLLQHGAQQASTGVPLLQNAIAAQNAYMKEAKSGQGVDRHLYALKCMAHKAGVIPPAFLSDELFVRSSTWRLSTSNAGTPATDRFGYGPVTSGGYGLGYLIHPDAFKVSVTAFAGPDFEDPAWPVDASKFAETIEASAQQLLQLAQQQH